MSKKIKVLIAILAIIVVTIPVSVYAFQSLPWTKNIYSISDPERVTCNGMDCAPATVSTFDDGGNRCYVINRSDSNPTSISCVRMR